MAAIGPWVQKSSKVVYENAWVRVRHDEVVDPSGRDGIYGVIETADALGCVPITEDLEVILVGQHRYPHDAYSWEIPEGGRHADESVEEGVLRELTEETGLAAGLLTSLGMIHTSNCFTNETAHLFLAEQLSEGQAAPDSTEEITVRRLPLADALAMVENGEILDALSVVALYRARDLLRGRGHDL